MPQLIKTPLTSRTLQFDYAVAVSLLKHFIFYIRSVFNEQAGLFLLGVQFHIIETVEHCNDYYRVL